MGFLRFLRYRLFDLPRHHQAKCGGHFGHDRIVDKSVIQQQLHERANYALYPNGGSGGQWVVYESGTQVTLSGATSQPTDVATITYDGSTIDYINNVSVRTVPVSGSTLYGFYPIGTPGSGLNSMRFGPTTNLAVADRAQLGANSASLLVSNATSGSVTINPNVSGTAVDSDVVSVTVTCDGSSLGIDISGLGQFINGNNCQMTTGLVTIRRDGSDIGTAAFDAVATLSALGTKVAASQVTLTVVDTPSAGSHTYTCHMHGQATGTSGSSAMQMTNTTIKVGSTTSEVGHVLPPGDWRAASVAPDHLGLLAGGAEHPGGPSADRSARRPALDHTCRRVNVSTGEVGSVWPPRPSGDHEWDADAERWQLSAAAHAALIQQREAQVRRAELIDQQHDLVRRLALDPHDAQARAALQALDAELATLHV